MRPRLPIDRLQAAVLAAMCRQTVRERRMSEVLTNDPKVRSER
jgi:hypothetical protein